MLVIDRKRGEGVLIGNDILIKVIKIKRNYIHLGIEAPKDVKVLRDDAICITDKSLDVSQEDWDNRWNK